MKPQSFDFLLLFVADVIIKDETNTIRSVPPMSHATIFTVRGFSFDWTTRRLGESAPAMTGRASDEYRLVQSVWTASFNPLS
jgi:hypothetical protein